VSKLLSGPDEAEMDERAHGLKEVHVITRLAGHTTAFAHESALFGNAVLVFMMNRR